MLGEVRTRLNALAAGDLELLFALRRKVYKELTYDERGKRRTAPAKRRRERSGCAAQGYKGAPATPRREKGRGQSALLRTRSDSLWEFARLAQEQEPGVRGGRREAEEDWGR